MVDQHANPVDEPLEDAHLIGTSLAEDSTGAALFTRWLPTLEAFVADLRRTATAHPEHPAHTAISTGGIGDHWPRIVPARAGRWPDGDPAAGATSRSRMRTSQRPPLTRREAEVLRLTEAGRSAAQIAKQLHTTVRTVYAHRRNARRKLREHDAHPDVTTFVPPLSHP